MSLAAGLRPDPLGELQRSPRPSCHNRGRDLLLRERVDKGGERIASYLASGYGPGLFKVFRYIVCYCL